MCTQDPITYIESIAAEIGFCEIKTVPSGEICFEKNVRTLCEEDWKAGRLLSWGSYRPELDFETCKAKCLSYEHATLLTMIYPAEDSMDFEAWMEAGLELNRMLLELGEQMQAELPEHMALGMVCRRCEKCTCPDAPCRHPENMVTASEAYGVHIMNTMEKEGITGYYDGTTIVCFGVMLWNPIY